MKKYYQGRSNEFKMCKGWNCNRRSSMEKCFVCDSTEDPLCATEPSSTHSKICDNYLNECFTHIQTDKVVRGCLYDHDIYFRMECQGSKRKCGTCTTMDKIACNSAPIPLNKCIDCNSTVDGRCRNKSNTIPGKICDNIGSTIHKGCYLSIVSIKHIPFFNLIIFFIHFIYSVW